MKLIINRACHLDNIQEASCMARNLIKSVVFSNVKYPINMSGNSPSLPHLLAPFFFSH